MMIEKVEKKLPNKVLNNDGSMQKSFRSLYQNQKVIIYP